MDLQALALDISTKLEAAGFDKAEAPTRQVLNLAEEVGEFVGAYRRWKGMARRTGTFDDVATELADVVITAYVTATELGIDLDRQIRDKVEVIYSRGWHEEDTQAEPRQPRVWQAGDSEPEDAPPVQSSETVWYPRDSGWCYCLMEGRPQENCNEAVNWEDLPFPLTEVLIEQGPEGGVS
jgi:NTP pyrophosphatase (non-canonical NTP hydrolase)